MSDTGRQSLTDKMSAAVKARVPPPSLPRSQLTNQRICLQPDSEKSTTEHIGDKFKGKSDSAAAPAGGRPLAVPPLGGHGTGGMLAAALTLSSFVLGGIALM